MFIQKNLHICSPTEFKPMLLKSQLYFYVFIFRRVAVYSCTSMYLWAYMNKCVCLWQTTSECFLGKAYVKQNRNEVDIGKEDIGLF